MHAVVQRSCSAALCTTLSLVIAAGDDLATVHPGTTCARALVQGRRGRRPRARRARRHARHAGGTRRQRLLPGLLPLLDGTRTVDDVGAALGARARPAVDRALDPRRSSTAHRRPARRRPRRGASSAAATLRRSSPAGPRRRWPRLAGARRDRRRRIRPPAEARAAAPPGRDRTRGARRRHDVPASDSLVVAAPPPDDTALLTSSTDLRSRGGRPGSRCSRTTAASSSSGRSSSPALSACGTCFALRRAACSGYEDDFALVDAAPCAPPRRRRSLAVAAALAATVVLRWLDRRPSLPGHLYASRPAGVVHAALRASAARAAVPVVRAGARRFAVPVVRGGRGDDARSTRRSTGWRQRLAADGHRHPRRLGDAHADESSTAELRLPSSRPSRRTLGGATVDYGSGAHPSRARARAAALGEAVERYSAIYLPLDGFRLATARALGGRGRRPRALRALPSGAARRCPASPSRRSPTTPTRRSSRASSLADGDTGVPARRARLPQPPREPSPPIAYPTSSGLACAPTARGDARRPLLELVERDAVMLAWKCRLSLPLLDWSGDGRASAPGRPVLRADAACGTPCSTASHFLDVPVAIAVVHGAPGSGAALAVGAGAAARSATRG